MIATRKIKSNKFYIYLLVGISAFICEYATFIFIVEMLSNMNLVLPQTISYIVGLLVSFFGNRSVTFKEGDSIHANSFKKQAGQYLVLAAINVVLSNILLQVLAAGDVNILIAKVIVIGAVALWNFIIFNKIIFKLQTKI